MDKQNFQSFEDAGRAILRYLHEHFGFGLWMITRVDGKEWIVLQAEDHAYNIQAGQVFSWAESFCVHMINGNAPQIAPRSSDISIYQNAKINQHLQIQSYIGLPLLKEDGSLFGTLCAIDPEPQPDSLLQHAALFELMSKLISQTLQAELRESEQIRQRERLEVEASTDSLTNLYNRRAWDRLMAAEEERCRRYAHPAAIFYIDLNNLKTVNDHLGHLAGDELIQKLADTLRKTVRHSDIIARLGGDEFTILSVENDEYGAEMLLQRLLSAFHEVQISVAIGYAVRHPECGLEAAAQLADQNMYAHKQKMKAEEQLEFNMLNVS